MNGHYEIRDIVDAHAKNLDGWFYVKAAAEIDTQGILYTQESSKANVPFTYHASIGAGLSPYTGSISIDLSALSAEM